MSSTSKGSEKRRFSRKPTRVEAVLAVGDKTSIQCVIVDFCEQGLFLQLQGPSAIGLQKNKTAKIYFSATTDHGREFFQIDAQIARVADDGIGIVFENISESMYKALIQTTDMGSIAAYSRSPSFFLASSNQDRFKNAFQDMLQINLPKLIQEFFKIAEDELEKNSEYIEDFKDVTALGNVASTLRINKENLINQFCQAIAGNFDFTSDKNSHGHAMEGRSGSSLSLVEKNEFEDWLNFSATIRKINAQFKNQLYQLELKLSYVTCFPRYLINNPIDPEHLCNGFRDTIADIEDSVAAKKTLYKAFQITLYNHLAKLYQVFDALLVEHGAPNDIAQDIIWKKNYITHARVNQSGESGHANQNLPTFDNDDYHYDDNWIPSAAPTIGQRQKQRPYVNQPISHTTSKLFNLINQSLAAAQPNYSDNFDSHLTSTTLGRYDANEYSPDELLAALTKLQATLPIEYIPEGNAATLLKGELEDGAGSLEGKAISPADKQKLDVYDELFQALLNELMLTPSIKTYLEKIKLPLMALTIQDPNFLDSETHPARNLLNQLFALESAVKHNKVIKNTQVKPLLDHLMSRITQSSITNPDIFAKVNEELREISQPIVKSRDLNINRVVEVYEGKQRLEKARRKVQDEIDARLAGKTLPSVIQLLLDSGWQHLLVITELNEEEQYNRQSYLASLDHLITWYADLANLPEDQFSAVQLELDFIDSKLGSVCTNAYTHNSIIEELTKTLLGSGIPRVRKPLDEMTITSKSVSLEKYSEIISDSWHLQVEQLKKGDWFTFSPEKQAFEPLKLVWIGEVPEVYVFVNRDGYKKQELTKHELAELLQTGVVTQIENLDEPLMDRATTSMLQKMQAKLIYSVSHDPVTNLPNRKRFINLLKDQILNKTNINCVLAYLEIEDFRIITNVCGIGGGDQLLIQVAQLISNELGEGSLVSRLGDKTFSFLLKNVNPEEGYEATKKIRSLINQTNFVWNDKSYTISVSVGLVPIVETNPNIEELLQKADTVNISAKRAGHNRIRVYLENDETLKEQTDIHEWAGRIDRIFAQNRLFARCQMISPIDPEKNTHSHYEILLGIYDEDGSVIPPDKFIPAVERCQRMPEVDRWVIENVFNWINDNRANFEKIGGFAINLSGQSLNSEEFLIYLKDRLTAGEIPWDKITFEVTETVAAGSLVFTKRFIKEIKQFGCKFSLDDFGTGYSSYSYLKSLDVDYLKIDGAFIKDITNSPTDRVMVNSMNEIAHSLQLETIAEYVENMDIHALLKEIGVDYAQGWGVHKPMPLTKLATTLDVL